MKFTSLRKSMICKFSKMSVTHPQSQQEETPTDQRHKSKLRRGPKSRTSAISVVAAGCGCQNRLGVVALDHQIPVDSHMPDVCSVQSLPSICSSPETNKVEEQCLEWRSNASFDQMLKWSSKSHGQEELVHYNKRSSFDNTSLELHQISYVKFNDLVSKFRLEKEKQITSGEFQHVRQSFASPKVKPQRQTGNICQTALMNKKVIRLADSLLIMKSSSDPRREFRDSMMEMIAENNIKDGKDLEELLAGYLLLNSAAYHDVIVEVFKQIWIELIQT